ncbi:MAG: LamG domain-containing protein [Verrucomicrobia bacterium]|nr:LamG domain-containing protein [Verrucomicrobiota bacterium]
MPALPPPLVFLLALPAWAAGSSAVDAWRFEASRPSETASPSLLLAPRARIEVVAGHAALTPGPAGPGPAALLVRPGARRGAEVAGTPLELGAGPWSFEARVWLRPEAGPDEGVLLALGPADAEPVLRLSALPAEEAVLVAALGPADGRGAQPPGWTREFADPGGPPHQRFREWTVLLTPSGRLPRGRWFHLACRHDGAGTLRLAVDGRDVAAAAAQLADPPRGGGLQLTLGGDQRGGRPWPGAIAEAAIRRPGPNR